MYINESVLKMQISIIRQIAARMSDYEDGIDMTVGEPRFDLPQELKEFMANIVLNERIKYSRTGGLLEFRKAVADFYNKIYEGNYTLDNVLASAGSTEGFSSFLRTVLKEGDEVLMPTPTYPGYEPNVLLMGAKPVYIDLKENDFVLTAEILEKYITDKTKVIILTYPNNPTGMVMPLEEMDKVAEIIKNNNIYLMSDEIYSMLSYEKFHSFARYREIEDKVVIINGLSKSHSMTGYRVGYTIASKKLIDNMNKVSQYTITGVSTVAQLGAIYALENIIDRTEIVEDYRRRVLFMKKGLEELGFKVINPDGAYYLFVDYSKFSDKKSLDFSLELLEKTHLGVTPGSCFNVEGYFRLSVTQDYEQLQEALNRLKSFVK